MQCLQRFYYYYIIMRSDKTAINYSMSCLNAGLVFRHSDLTVELATAVYWSILNNASARAIQNKKNLTKVAFKEDFICI